jgi:predicted acylesterase/phospholipase RssA
MASKTNGAAAAGKKKIGVALAGGGPLGAVYEIGALIALNEALEGMDFQHVNVYVGVSAGAMISALLANGIAPEDMARVFIRPRPGDARFSPLLFLQPNYREYLRRMANVPPLLLEGVTKYLRNPLKRGLLESLSGLTRAVPTAIFDNEPMERFLSGLFANRGFSNDFRKLVKELYIVAVDLDTGESVRFGGEGMDHVPISRAVQASTALPGLYPPVKIEGRDFVDGGLKRTLHASVALDAGCDLLFCINPIVPYDADLAPADEQKRHHKLIEGGLPVVLSQTFRAMIHSRMRVGMSKYDSLYPQAKIVLFEPDRHDSRMFFTNVFSYSDRENVCQHAYRTTRRDLRARQAELGSVLSAHGIKIRHGILENPDRHFSEALASAEGMQDVGVYMNQTTNRLSEALDGLDGWLEAQQGMRKARRRTAE